MKLETVVSGVIGLVTGVTLGICIHKATSKEVECSNCLWGADNDYYDYDDFEEDIFED